MWAVWTLLQVALRPEQGRPHGAHPHDGTGAMAGVCNTPVWSELPVTLLGTRAGGAGRVRVW